MTPPKTLIFWGAGATAALGIRTSLQQAKFVQALAATDNPRGSLAERIATALGAKAIEPWNSALRDLLTILGDRPATYHSIHAIDDAEMEAMRRNWQAGAGHEELRRRIIELRLNYDWPALKSVIRVCPGSGTDNFKINDLFNVLDMHIPGKFGFRAPAETESSALDQQFLDARRLIGAKNALYVILLAMFHIDYQVCINQKPEVLAQYLGFARHLGHRMRQRGIALASGGERLDRPEFYRSDVSFVSLNYDPVALWVQFIAHRELNGDGAAPHLGSPAVPLHLYHEFGHLIPARGVERTAADWPWYPLNEAAAQRLNEEKYPSGYRVRLTKFLFPHGCLCWRECPDCGKLSAYHGDLWDLYSTGLFPPPPLQAFDRTPRPDKINGDERDARMKGAVDARACLHCGTLTYAQHTQTVMQSSFKSAPPSFIEEIQRDLRAETMKATHIIFLGYSLPPDDVTYRAFFSARSQRRDKSAVRCTIVNLDDSNSGWLGADALKARAFPKDHVVSAVGDIFGKDNIRFYGGGAPAVFLDGAGTPTPEALDRLLDWSST